MKNTTTLTNLRRNGGRIMPLTKKELYNRLLITRDIDDINRYRKTVDDIIRWIQIDLENGDEW